MSDDGLTQRRLIDKHHTIFRIYWHGLLVGSVVKRIGNPSGTDGWEWFMGAPGQMGAIHGTAGSYDEARFTWKKRWPTFRDARSYDDWKRVRGKQERDEKDDNVREARKLTAAPEIIAALDKAAGDEGPTPKWVLDMLDGKPPSPPKEDR